MSWWKDSIFDGCTKKEAKILWAVVILTSVTTYFLMYKFMVGVDKHFSSLTVH